MELEAWTVDVIMGSHRIFSRGGQIKGFGTKKVAQRDPAMEPRCGLWIKPPETDDWL